MTPKVLLLLSFSILCAVNGYKILVYNPKLGRSHMLLGGKVADILAKAGHDVVVYQPIVDENITFTGSKLARVIERQRDWPLDFNFDEMQENVWSLEEPSLSKLMEILGFMRTIQATNCKHILKDDAMLAKLKAEKFELSIGEPFDMCFYGINSLLGIDNYISLFPGAGPMFNGHFGIPATPSFVGEMMSGPPPFTYFQRAKNLIGHVISSEIVPKYLVEPINDVIKEKLGRDFDVMERLSDSTLVFVNADPHLNYPTPTTHKFINIGGLAMAKPKPLEKKYEEIFNSSKKGVVLVSFGSVAQSWKMPDALKKKFLETFAQFPDITFLWKYEKDEHKIAEGYDNVITGNWLPQTDILAHPKLLAFLSHGGANSVMEAAFAGVPLICIPLMGDQFSNAMLAEYRKMATVVQKTEILEGKLKDAIRKIVEDNSYHTNAKRLSSMIKRSPLTPDEKIVKYAEFAAEFGKNNNLDMSGRHLSFMAFYCLDIIIPAIGLVFLVLYVLYRFTKFLLKKILSYFVMKSKLE